MSLTVSTKTYAKARSLPDSIQYNGPANTLSVKDSIEYKRVYPKPTKDFAGVGRPTAKITRTNALGVDSMLQVTGSIAVGTTPTEITALVADLISLVGLASFLSLCKDLTIEA